MYVRVAAYDKLSNKTCCLKTVTRREVPSCRQTLLNISANNKYAFRFGSLRLGRARSSSVRVRRKEQARPHRMHQALLPSRKSDPCSSSISSSSYYPVFQQDRILSGQCVSIFVSGDMIDDAFKKYLRNYLRPVSAGHKRRDGTWTGGS